MTYPVTACDFTPAWEPWVPSTVAGLLDGIVAADALPDMSRWGMVSDALSDCGHDDAADRVRDGAWLWHAAETLEVPARTPKEWDYNARVKAFSGAAESGPGLVRWRRLSLYSVLLIHCGPSGDDRSRLWHLYDGPHADLRVRRVLSWGWGVGLGLANRSQADAALSTAYAARSTAYAALSTATAAGSTATAAGSTATAAGSTATVAGSTATAARSTAYAAGSTAYAALYTANAAQEQHWQYARRLWSACKVKKGELCKA